MRVLALEASTQAAKAAVVDERGNVLSQVAHKFPPQVSDVQSMDAPGVFDALMQAGREAVSKAGGKIDAAGLCTIWQSLLPLDARGEPLMRAWTWAHTASGAVAARWRKDEQICHAFYERTGCIPHSQLPAVQARYLRECMPELMGKAMQWGSLSSYLLRRMTGEAAYSRCTVSGCGLMNIHTREYDPWAVELSGIAREALPPLCDADETLYLTRETAALLGVGQIPLAAGGGDGALNQIGSGALRPGVMTCSIGTSAALRLASRKPVLPQPPATFCYDAAQGWYIAGAATSGACNCVDWVRENMLGGQPFSQLEQAMTACQDNWAKAPIFLPFLWGERCPRWNDERRGGFTGLRGGHGTGELYYAALEGVLLLLRMCYDILTQAVGAPQVLGISGGIVHSALWLAMAADIFGRPIEISSVENASLMGAAALALRVGGALEDLSAYPVREGRMIMPRAPMQEHYAQRLMLFQEAYEA